MNNDAINSDKGRSSNDDDLSNEMSSMNFDNNSSNKKKKKKNTCLCCLKEVEGCSRCSQCRTALYCDRDCQLKHWPVHKNICQDSNNAENSAEKLDMKARNHLKQGNN
jgi:hypothetical protein